MPDSSTIQLRTLSSSSDFCEENAPNSAIIKTEGMGEVKLLADF